MMIKLWNWEQNWRNVRVGSEECVERQTYEGHSHYVMQVKFNPKDSNTFASCSLDNTIKVWGLNTSSPYYTLSEHKAGVNCLCYSPAGDKPYLLSGSDDKVRRFAPLTRRRSASGTTRRRPASRRSRATRRT